jgi:hypothetical protein
MMNTAHVTTTWKKHNLKIQPCILVTEKLNVGRGVSYNRRDKDTISQADGSEISIWETERHYKNKEEAKQADQVYANARYKIRAKCLYTEVGYICPASQESELRGAIDEAREMVEDFNKRARHCHIEFRVVCTRIEPENSDGVAVLKEALDRSTQQIKESLAEFDFKKARNLLAATKPAIDILKDPTARKALNTVREEARVLATEIANVVKEYDNNIENALVSTEGQDILRRANAKWNF